MAQYRKWLLDIGDETSVLDLDAMGISKLDDFLVAASAIVSYSRVGSLAYCMSKCLAM